MQRFYLIDAPTIVDPLDVWDDFLGELLDAYRLNPCPQLQEAVQEPQQHVLGTISGWADGRRTLP
ncbi:MAG: hypothetical protein AB7S74_18280 [Hyphomicrobium sp.]